MSVSAQGIILYPDERIDDRWKVIGKVGGGGFGQIYRAYDLKRKTEVAAKIESVVIFKQTGKTALDKKEQRKEAAVLKLYQGKPHAPEFIGSGQTTRFNYLIMQLLSINLTQLRRKSPHQRLSVGTTYRVIQQGVEALQDLHAIGFLHRDVKPSNFATGITLNTMRTIYVFDFGLARRFVDKEGKLRAPRRKTGFRGTVRYSSIATHKGQELGRHDDLWSLFYTVVELVTGSLPWRKVKDKKKAEQLKTETTMETLCEKLPRGTTGFGRHLQTLTYYDKPDYDFLTMLLEKVLKDEGVKREDPFDWEEKYKNVKDQLSINSGRSRQSGRRSASRT